MVGLEQEMEAAKAALEPIRLQRETAKGEIQVQRERMEAIEVGFTHGESHDTLPLMPFSLETCRASREDPKTS